MLTLFYRNLSPMGNYERLGNPKGYANVFSALSFWWMNGILGTGSKRPLENTDLYPLLEEDRTQGLTEKLEKTWKETFVHHPPNTNKHHRLLKALLNMFPRWEYAAFTTTAALAAICNVLQLVFLSLLLTMLAGQSAHDTWHVYVYGLGVCLSNLGRVLVSHHFFYNSRLMGMRWKAAIIGLILKKVSLVCLSFINKLGPGIFCTKATSTCELYRILKRQWINN